VAGHAAAERLGLPGLDEQAERIAALWLRAVYASFEARLTLGQHAEVLPIWNGSPGTVRWTSGCAACSSLALYRADRQAMRSLRIDG
jgi:hypothetical protein